MPKEKPVEASLVWKPNAHKCQDQKLNPGLIDTKQGNLRWAHLLEPQMTHDFLSFFSGGAAQVLKPLPIYLRIFLPLHIPFSKVALCRIFICHTTGISDVDDSITAMYQAVSELPSANRDTLAYVILHLQR